MKRVQVIIEEWQQEWLAEEASRHSVSMSALLRELLTEAIERRQTDTVANDPIWGIIGLGEGPDDGVTSENLDEVIYRVDWAQQPLKMAAESSGSDADEETIYAPDHR